MKEFDLAEAAGGRCQEDKFWISTELSHGEGVRSGVNGVICSNRQGAESKNLITKTSAADQRHSDASG